MGWERHLLASVGATAETEERTVKLATGWAAFPGPYSNVENQGLTMRDYFAAKAMAQLMQLSAPDGHEDATLTAAWAYAYADAMMEARK
jgi:hypothetical protein